MKSACWFVAIQLLGIHISVENIHIFFIPCVNEWKERNQIKKKKKEIYQRCDDLSSNLTTHLTM